MSTILGVLSILIAITSYSLYFRGIFKGRTHPHSFTWLIWGVLNAMIFYQQMSNGAGAGGWVTGVASIANLLIFVLGLRYGERQVTRLDYACLLAAAAAIICWLMNQDSVLSAVLASSVFVIGLIPTWRKSFTRAYEETALTFALNSLKFLVALFALESFTTTTALYPVVLCVANGAFAVFLIVQRMRKPHKKRTQRKRR